MSKRVQVALTESISSLGKEGDLVEVAPGYARNFLIPFGKAMNVTPAVLKQIERKKEKEKIAADKLKQEALDFQTALTFGDGWHNNHHAFPNSAKQGLFKGQIDITWEHIKILAKLGLAKKVKLPSRSYY